MRLIVTGGCGFIGSNFIRHVLSEHEDIEVVNVDNLSYGANLNNLKDLEDDRRYRFVRGNICDTGLMSRLLEDAEAFVNFAAESHVDRSIADPWPFFKSNTEGVLVLLEAVRRSSRDVRLIQVGTDESYGDILEGSFKEEDRLKPSSPYAASKASADLFCLAYHRTYGLNVCVTRCTNNFGPYQFPEKLVPKTIVRAMLNLKIPIYGTGRNVRDWIYVSDHCEALDMVLRKGRKGEVYNVSSGNELSNLQVVDKILELMGKPKDLVEFVEDRPGHDIRYSLDSSKIRSELGWRPRHSFMEALKNTVEWYTSNEWWWKPLAGEQVLHPTPWKLKW
ncbi:MAG: dTDP-glucose 4,6-dehydratase [Candidatus Brockarchaeota archaeon]|nr:dTDP-glucose 4,6-dehydratase [Candidatus Brockarchaeota archaeon]MBO3808889.1 dTDP-glucose 4,6-dehydratase [Candidatus Brockarchaeota archaeon]